MSQKLQNYAESQANNLHSFITQLLQDLEEEKKRVKNADISTIKEQIKAYEKLSGNIETEFDEVYGNFTKDFFNNLEDGLEKTLEEFIQKTEKDNENQKGKEDEYFTKKVKQDGFSGSVARFFGQVFSDEWGYEQKEFYKKVTSVKAGAVVDFLIKMHNDCEKALNRSSDSFNTNFKNALYAKVFSQLRQIIPDDLIDEVAFKKSVMAVLDSIEFKEFDYTDKLPSEMRAQTGELKGDEANVFIQSVGNYVRNFESEAKKDVKGYIQGLRETLERQNFTSDTLKKLEENMQDLHNQAQNKEQSIAQLDAQIKALKGIQ
ncbi:hypothetical protein KVL27_04600 [Helicobacter pylori]|nr:hypothetical protein KVL27_04600 [Helicobacter pylori]